MCAVYTIYAQSVVSIHTILVLSAQYISNVYNMSTVYIIIIIIDAQSMVSTYSGCYDRAVHLNYNICAQYTQFMRNQC